MEMQGKKKHKQKVKFWKNPKILPMFMGLFIISIMIFSVLGLWTGSDDQGVYEYQGMKFIQTNYGWTTYKDDTSITIATHPQELEEIKVPYIPVYSLNSLEKVYFSLDYNEQVLRAVQEFETNIPITAIKRQACIEDNEACANLPLKTCEDATTTTGVIVFKKDNETKVNLENNCLTLQGPQLLKIVDKLIITQL